jgi:predicted  nucleic acid-binding Zn-ribbon protein
MNEIQNTLKADIEKYKTSIQQNRSKLEEYRTAIGNLQAEITLLSGALQQAEKILAEMSKGEKVDDAESKVE